jgi:hypothetical protein
VLIYKTYPFWFVFSLYWAFCIEGTVLHIPMQRGRNWNPSDRSQSVFWDMCVATFSKLSTVSPYCPCSLNLE